MDKDVIHTFMYKHAHIMKYYSAIKKIMPFAAIWMDLNIITLSEISQKENTNSI